KVIMKDGVVYKNTL
ncbi:amidohydrolase family protein, partial [Vibrio harveyi]